MYIKRCLAESNYIHIAGIEQLRIAMRCYSKVFKYTLSSFNRLLVSRYKSLYRFCIWSEIPLCIIAGIQLHTELIAVYNSIMRRTNNRKSLMSGCDRAVQISNGNSLRRYIKHACVLTILLRRRRRAVHAWRNTRRTAHNGNCSRLAWLQVSAASKACRAACSQRLDNCRAPTAGVGHRADTLEATYNQSHWGRFRSMKASPSNDERRLLYV